MREELYLKLKIRLESLCINGAGEYYERPDDADMDDELYPRAIKHIDLWFQFTHPHKVRPHRLISFVN